MVSINSISNISFSGNQIQSRAKQACDKLTDYVTEMMDPENGIYEKPNILNFMDRIGVKSKVSYMVYDAREAKEEGKRVQDLAKETYKNATVTINTIKDYVKNHKDGTRFYDDISEREIHMDGIFIKEFDKSGKKVRETTLSGDRKRIDSIEDIMDGSINFIKNTEDGIVIAKDRQFLPGNKEKTRREYYYDKKGNLNVCLKNIIRKNKGVEGLEVSQVGKSFEYKNGRLTRVLIGLRETPNKIKAKQDFTFTKTGALKSTYEGVIHKNNQTTYAEGCVFEEEEKKVPNSVNEYETIHRLLYDNGKVFCKTNIYANRDGKLYIEG